MPSLLRNPQDLLSPDADSFSTPPQTPNPPSAAPAPALKPSLSRRASTRLSSINIPENKGANADIQLELTSPDSRTPNGSAIQEAMKKPGLLGQEAQIHHPLDPNDKSPCLVHWHLDKGADLTKITQQQAHLHPADLGVAKSLQMAKSNGTGTLNARLDHATQQIRNFSPDSVASFASGYDDDDDDEFGSSLTTRLAETAVGVREMSKQLGRARIQSNIQNVLIVTKAKDNRLIKLTRELALYLMLKRTTGQPRGLVVYVDSQLRKSRRFDAEGIKKDHPELFAPFPRRRGSSTSYSSSSDYNGGENEGQLRYWTPSMCSKSPHLFDFVVTLGGDGTILFTSWLFQKIVPPVLSFALGSLGFLTNFDFVDHQAVMDSAIDNGIRVNLRMRFTCTVFRAVAVERGKGRKAVKKGDTGEIMMKNLEKGGWEALEGGGNSIGSAEPGGKCGKDKEIMCYTTRPVESFEVLNDLVVDRGPSPYVSQLELFGDDDHMTTVQADGLTISTPTGSTAYSLSAGGSLAHPEIPAILITPICPHTLSFRPMLLPDSMELRICVPYNSRSTAWASFDGRGRVELKQGDHIKVTASRYPFPTVCADKQSTDWFHAISRTLKWNERERQKSFVLVEEGPEKKPTRRRRAKAATAGASHSLSAAGAGEEGAQVKTPRIHDVEGELSGEDDEGSTDEEEEEEEEETFDIDDSAPENEEKLDAQQTSEEFGHLRPTGKDTKKRRAKSRSKSRTRATPSSVNVTYSGDDDTSPLPSGVNSPSRFGRPHLHGQSERHVDFRFNSHSGGSSPSSTSEPNGGLSHEAHHGLRDDIHSQKSPGSKSRIPAAWERERDGLKEAGSETPRTATVPLGAGRGRGHSVSRVDGGGHRAFAVWGQDESDSAASDNDY